MLVVLLAVVAVTSVPGEKKETDPAQTVRAGGEGRGRNDCVCVHRFLENMLHLLTEDSGTDTDEWEDNPED